MKRSCHPIHTDGKFAKSNPFHFKTTHKRLIFNYFKELLIRFNGTAMKLCSKLGINCRIIADYDAFYRGKLREIICQNLDIQHAFIENALGDNISKNIGELERLLSNLSNELISQTSTDPEISKVIAKLAELYKEKDKNISQIFDVVHLSLYRIKDKLISLLPQKENDINSFLVKHKKQIECIKSGNIFIIPDGELEHFFKASTIDYLNITQKDKFFEAERDFIMKMDDAKQIKADYQDILPLLTESIPHIEVDMLKHIRFSIMDWVQKVQNAVARGEVRDIVSLQNNARVNYKLYSQIMECTTDGFTMQENGAFSCTIRIKKTIIGEEKLFSFTEKTVTSDIIIE